MMRNGPPRLRVTAVDRRSKNHPPRKAGAPVRLHVNIDHVATVRQARRAEQPDPVEWALVA
jgi:hypothetical protein